MYNFITKPAQAEYEGEMIQTIEGENDILLEYEGDFAFSPVPMPSITAWCDEGPYATVTQFVPEIEIEPGEVVLHHDILCDSDFVKDLIEYIGEGYREAVFGPFGTETYVLKLKNNWKDLVVKFDE